LKPGRGIADNSYITQTDLWPVLECESYQIKTGTNMGEQQLEQIRRALTFTKLLKSFKMAVSPTKLIITMSIVLIVCVVGWTMDAYTVTVETRANQELVLKSSVSALATFGNAAELEIYATDPKRVMNAIEEYKRQGRGVFSTLWNFSAARFNRATVSLLQMDIASVIRNIWLFGVSLLWALKYHTVYSFIHFVLVSPIVCIFGGAICRIGALEFARNEKPGLGEALRFGLKNFVGFFTGPAVSVGLMVFFGSFVFLLGFLGNLPWVGDIVIGFGLIGALLFGLLTVIMLIGIVVGTSLMFPAVAYEGSDGFDAISRTFNYVFAQPWWWLLYTLIAAVCGTISYLFLRFLAFLLLIITYLLLDMGLMDKTDGTSRLAVLWPKPEFFNLVVTATETPIKWSESLSAFLIHMAVLFVVGLLVAFVISFFFCASTVVYALLRNKIDGTDLDEIYIELEQVQSNNHAGTQGLDINR